MGQCCQASSNLPEPDINIHFLSIPTDPSEQLSSHPQYLTARSQETKRLGEIEEADIVQEPQLNEQVKNKLSKLKPIDAICFQNFQGKRGDYLPDYFKIKRTGTIYQGEWYQVKPNGKGKHFYQNGGFYEGTFIDALPHGYGRFVSADGNLYEGEVKYGRGNGVGVYEGNQREYRGEFKNNAFHGQGQEKGRGIYFKGIYEAGERKEGMLKYDGNVYEGPFQNDLFEGKGKLTTIEGHYTGFFKCGFQHGYGQFIWNNGSIYRGNYSKGQKQGDGQFYDSSNKSISRGIWKRGILNGDGQYVQPRGKVNRCIWYEGKLVGVR